MPLTRSEKRTLLGDADRVRREAAYEFFCNEASPSEGEPAVLDAIAAVNRYGWWQAFPHPSGIASWPQTDESIRWFLKHADVWTARPTVEEVPESADYFADLYPEDWCETFVVAALVDLELPLLREHAAAIAALPTATEEHRRAIDERLQLADAEPEALWERLVDECRKNQGEWADDEAPQRIDKLIDAIGRHASLRERVLASLAQTEVDAPIWSWIAVRLTARMRLDEALPILIDLLQQTEPDDDYLIEELERTIPRIGGDRAVPLLVEKYATSSWTFQFSTATICEYLGTPTAVQAALDLASSQSDAFLRCRLLQAAICALDERAVEPTLRYLRSSQKDVEYLELRSDLLRTCAALDVSFPEREEWIEDAKHDREHRRNLYSSVSAVQQALNKVDAWEAADPEFLDDPDAELDAAPPLQAVATAGRNDPCPCGSGKKYKKCCLRSDVK